MKKPFLITVSLFVCVLFVFQTTAFAAEEILFYHTDPVGTPLAMSNMSGQKVWEADYKPFGEEFSAGGSMGNSKRFVGKEKDAETGLNYFGARYLSAGTGRFLAPDTVRAVNTSSGKVNNKILLNLQRQNLYAYSLNNPNKYVDPDAKSPVLALALLGAFIYGNLMTPGVANAPDEGDGIFEGPSSAEVMGNTVAGAAIGATVALKGSVTGAREVVEEAAGMPTYGATPKGRPLTKHYATETGPKRNIPGSVVDNTIDTTKGVQVKGDKTVHYDPRNNVTVVTGRGQSIVSSHKGPPRKGQY